MSHPLSALRPQIGKTAPLHLLNHPEHPLHRSRLEAEYAWTASSSHSAKMPERGTTTHRPEARAAIATTPLDSLSREWRTKRSVWRKKPYLSHGATSPISLAIAGKRHIKGGGRLVALLPLFTSSRICGSIPLPHKGDVPDEEVSVFTRAGGIIDESKPDASSPFT